MKRSTVRGFFSQCTAFFDIELLKTAFAHQFPGSISLLPTVVADGGWFCSCQAAALSLLILFFVALLVPRRAYSSFDAHSPFIHKIIALTANIKKFYYSFSTIILNQTTNTPLRFPFLFFFFFFASQLDHHFYDLVEARK